MIKEIKIFQIKETTENIPFLYCNFDFCLRYGFKIRRESYRCVYEGPLKDGSSLEDIYYRFNIELPASFKGHSLSVSDVVEINENEVSRFYFVDSIGFKEIADFLG